MSSLALPLGTGKIRIVRRSRVAVHPLLAPKRLLQLAMIALIVVPIPSDDGPFKSHTSVVQQAKPVIHLTASMVASRGMKLKP